jgi:hypothetical protein
MLERTVRAFGVVGALALLLAFTGSAYATRVTYIGQPDSNPRRFVSFDLVGKGCPKGPHCFDHARVYKFSIVSFSFPNCPDILENAFDYDDYVHRGVKVDKKHRTFDGSGSLAGVNVAFHGHFVDRAAHAKGWYKVNEESCTTGQKPWKIGIYKPPK